MAMVSSVSLPLLKRAEPSRHKPSEAGFTSASTDSLPSTAPSARIADLAGKKIGLYWNEKPGGNHFWNGVEQLLKEKLPKTTIVRFSGAFDLGDELAAKMASETDAFLYGVGD